MKFTKAQLEAIKCLLANLDELENKPRRLYYALEKLASAFDMHNAIPSIREAQDIMYGHINEGDQYRELFNSLRDFTIKEWDRQIKNQPFDVRDSEKRISGAREFLKCHIKRLAETRIDH